MREHGSFGAIGTLVLCLASSAIAAPSDAAPIALRWTAPSGCPAEQEVRGEIDRLLGGAPDPSSPRHLRAEAVVVRTRNGGLHVHLTTDMGGSVGERDLDAPSCAALAKVTALIVALTFDPEAVAKQSTSPVAPEPPPVIPIAPAPIASIDATKAVPTTPLPAPIMSPRSPPQPLVRPLSSPLSRAPREAPPRRRSKAPTFIVSAAAAISLGALPGVGSGIGGGVGFSLDHLRADVSAVYWPEMRSAFATRPTAGGNVRLFMVDARGCYRALLAPIELAPCAGIAVGSMSADGFGVKSPGSGAALWIAPLAEVAVALPIGRHFALRIDLGALVPLRRPTFALEQLGSVHRASALVGRAVLAAEARF